MQGGFDYQFAPNWVMGIEAQYSWLPTNNNNGVLFPGGTLVTSNTDQLGSVTGRLGYTWGPALLYAKGGYAWRDGNNIGVAVAGVVRGLVVDAVVGGVHDVADGGLALALAEMVVAGATHAVVEFSSVELAQQVLAGVTLDELLEGSEAVRPATLGRLISAIERGGSEAHEIEREADSDRKHQQAEEETEPLPYPRRSPRLTPRTVSA